MGLNYDAVKAIQDLHEESLHSIPGVWGVGIYKLDEKNQSYGIKVLANNKFEPSSDSAFNIPKELSNEDNSVLVPVQVEVISGGASLFGYTGMVRPVKPGWSVGRQVYFTGTIGLIVKRGEPKPIPFKFPPYSKFWPLQFPFHYNPVVQSTDNSSERFILSASHVFAGILGGHVGDIIIQPGPLDPPPTSAVATLFDFYLTNDVDCAIALLDDPSGYDPVIQDIGRPVNIADSHIKMQVQKTGRTTQHTSGDVYMKNVSFPITTGVGRGLFFTGMDMMRLPAAPGDSGSAVCGGHDKGDATVVGLLFAGIRGSIFSFACPITRVMQKLQIELA